MTRSADHGPDVMPVLTRGRHRSAKQGACFMEMASYLAGERWSDHPSCTHPLLAAMARDVNDHVTDASRGRLVRWIPDVVGLRSDDPRGHAWIAREAALAALPVAAEARQRVAAVGLLRCEQVLNVLEDRPVHHLDPRTRACLDDVPLARDWARDFITMGPGRMRTFARRSAPAIVHGSVCGIFTSTAADPDDLLIGLLERTVTLCRERFLTADPAPQLAPAG